MQLSVIICTHNPRPDYLRRVLDALRAQTLPKEQWELLLIDNASNVPLAKSWNLSWHPHARHLHEEELGLTPARLRGIKESKSEFSIFVDDDNVLAADYLAGTLSIFNTRPELGVIGGSIKGEFEIPPPDWIAPYLEGLVICELERDYWSNLGGWSRAEPYGAGMCVRRAVATDYYQKATSSPLRKLLGRSGTALSAGEDSDMAMCAIDLGLGTGRFCALKLTHLIPRGRLTEEYVIRLFAGFAAAKEIAAVLRPNGQVNQSPSWKKTARFWFDYLRASGLKRRMLAAANKARKHAREMIAKYSENQLGTVLL
jgi:hypothetical protein